MSGRTRDWLKFGGLVGIAFIFGLAFASALELPKPGRAAELLQTPAPASRQPPAVVRPAADLGSAFATVADLVKPAVVFIRSDRRERVDNRRLPPGFEEFFPFPRNRRPPVEQGTGSGFIVSPDGYILTNNHVVEDATRITVRLYDKREFQAQLVGTDPNTDVAVIKVDARNLPTASFANSDSTRIGEWVLAIGNPLGEAFTFTVTAGIVSAKGRILAGLRGDNNYSIQDFIQTDAAINPGNSGGPLVDIRGQVIGINAAIASETGLYAGYGFAIPINLARTVMTQLIKTGHVQRAVMGISIRDVTAEDADLMGLKEIRGVVVNDFTPAEDSPAKRAGLAQGDVIVELEGQPVEYVAQLQQRVGFKKPGETVQVTVLRGRGERKTFSVRLAEAPGGDDVRAAANDAGAAESNTVGTREEALGISVQPLPQEEARDARLRVVTRAGGGMVVTEVSPDGPAFRRLVGTDDQGGPDIILAVNGQATRTRAELRAALRGLKAGDIVTLQVFNYSTGAQRIVRLRVR
ncbi:MAG: Do family serine endopeptidase [Gemmatimonadales bacterium]